MTNSKRAAAQSGSRSPKSKAQSAGRWLISVVIPVFNEEDNVENAYKAVTKVFDGPLRKYGLEIVFTDNHSTDRTFEKLAKIAAGDERVKVARFSRNFGFNRSLLTGYRLASGDAAIQLDCDLQDPPELFPKFIESWAAGHDVVVGLRQQRPESKWLLALRKTFYRLLRRMSDDAVIVDGGDFRLVDRSVLDQLDHVNEATPYVRGLVSNLGTNIDTFPYLRRQREHGQSKYPLIPLIGLAVEGVISHSVLPLRFATLFGVFIGVAAVLLSILYALARLVLDQEFPAGFTTIVILELISISINCIFLGVIGEYLARIHLNIKNRPITIVQKSINL